MLNKKQEAERLRIQKAKAVLNKKQKAERIRIQKARAEYEAVMKEHTECVPKKADEWDSAECAICGADLGWWCPKSKTHLCEYKVDEWCIHCGEPEERK